MENQTPTTEALDLAETLRGYDTVDARGCAAIIDRHFEPLRQRAERAERIIGELQDAELKRTGERVAAEARVKELEAACRYWKEKYEANETRRVGDKCDVIDSLRADNADLKQSNAKLAGALREARLYVAGHTNNTAMHLHKLISTTLARHAAGEPVKHPDTVRLETIRQLCGYIEDGTSTEVRIFQDDATGDWFVNKHFGTSLREAIDEATRKEVKP